MVEHKEACDQTGDINESYSLASGASVTYTVVVSIPGTFSGHLVNTATVSGPLPDPDPLNNIATDTDTEQICASPPLVTLSSSSGTTCGLALKTVGSNTFVNAGSVAITENGAGTVTPSASSSPFSFTYTPAVADIGNSVTITFITNDPDGTGPCKADTATYSLSVLVTPAAPSLATVIQPTCAVPTGTITVTAPLGANYEYSINGVNYQSSPVFSLVAPGTYSVTTKNVTNGCVSATGTPATVDPVPLAPVLNSVTVTQPTCAVPSGTIVVSATGSGTLEYSVNAGALWQASNTFSGLIPGSYYVWVRLQSNPTCVSIYTNNPVTINAVPVVPVVSAPTVTQPTCNVPTGTIVINSTGSGVLEYSINGGISYQTGNTFAGLAPGHYFIRVRLQSNPTCYTAYINNPVIINEVNPSPLVLILTHTNATTPGCNNGAALASASGGTAPYTYLWNTGATTAAISNLTAGIYTVTVTDSKNCTAVQSVVVDCINTCDDALRVLSVTPVNCYGTTTGSATVSASSVLNPTNTYTYLWSNGQTGSALSNAPAGTYMVTATPSNGCSPVSQSVVITGPSSVLSVQASSTGISGVGINDGTATALPSGGTPGYTYLWNTGATTAIITGLGPGTYTVTVTDSKGCTAQGSVTILPFNCQGLSATTTAITVSCAGSSNGSATAIVTGGSGNFGYSWNTVPVQTTQTASGLLAGTYTVIVHDNITGCNATATAVVGTPAPLMPVIAVTDVKCSGSSTGSLDLTVSGGTAPYTFRWSNGATTEDIINVRSGVYTVLITDSRGCMKVQSATVNSPASLSLIMLHTNASPAACNNGTARVMVSGGSPVYTYLWNTGATTASISNLVPAYIQ